MVHFTDPGREGNKEGLHGSPWKEKEKRSHGWTGGRGVWELEGSGCGETDGGEGTE